MCQNNNVIKQSFKNLRGEPMSNITLLAVDLAKQVFQLHGIDAEGKTVLRKKLVIERNLLCTLPI